MIAVFDDADSFAAYGSGYENIGDFRRANVNLLIKEVYTAIKESDKKCRFGVAPFGIWKNLAGENGGSATRGLESYYDLYCDTLAWCEAGTVDFVAPQIYWECDSSVASFEVLAKWWSEKLEGTDVDLYFSHAAYRYADGDFTPGEMTKQYEFSKALPNYRGSVFYSFAAFRDDLAGICGEIGMLKVVN